jgi:hypothetical protein
MQQNVEVLPGARPEADVDYALESRQFQGSPRIRIVKSGQSQAGLFGSPAAGPVESPLDDRRG